jgi:hypothetical protein
MLIWIKNMYFVVYLTTFCGNSGLYSVEWKDDKWILSWKSLEENGRGFIYVIILEFAWMD